MCVPVEQLNEFRSLGSLSPPTPAGVMVKGLRFSSLAQVCGQHLSIFTKSPQEAWMGRDCRSVPGHRCERGASREIKSH